VHYEPLYERFEAGGPEGESHSVEFVKSGFLTAGDRPELFFFRVDGEQTVVGISGASLERFQRGRRRLSREEKVDLAGFWLKRQLETGAPLDSAHLLLRDEELGRVAADLGLTK
jgi:hypothetical protein